MAEHENLPPRGYVQALPTITYPERELPAGTPSMWINTAEYPALCRALNLIREDNGGPAWPPTTANESPQRWAPWLDRMEAAVAALRDDAPAPEDPDGQESYKLGNQSYLDSERYCFVNGEYTAQSAIARRTPELTAASNFLCDFFEGWTSYDDPPEGETFDPSLRLMGDDE